jgi:hypothetical protein
MKQKVRAIFANQRVWLYWLRNISDDALPEADGTKDLLKSRVSSHEGLSPLRLPPFVIVAYVGISMFLLGLVDPDATSSDCAALPGGRS